MPALKNPISATIKVQNLDVNTLAITAEDRGHFLVHREITSAGKDEGERFCVTHKASSLQAARCRNLTAARKVARILSDVPADWNATDPDAIFASREDFRAAYELIKPYRI